MNFKYSKNKIYFEGELGKPLAWIEFVKESDQIVNILHTVVDPSLAGQGVAGKMTETLMARLRQEGKKVIPTCSYTIKWFEKHPEEQDLRVS